ncbi:MAG: hypothetical protein VX404_02205 [Planctomycetota bacterium]|nr:hypothetical protein [Planctomycetota bacterium]
MSDEHREFLRKLPPQERTLLVLREELYEGSWDEMKVDLKSRLNKGPHVFELAEKIEADMERIERLVSYENSHDIDLGEYLDDEE